MTDLVDWLEARRPPPPPELTRVLLAAVQGVDPQGSVVERLALAGSARLEIARTPDSRPRDGAFDLLAADALVTYACEAALEEPDVEGSLTALLTTYATP